MEVIFNIKKKSVYDEVAKLTSYIGAKTIADTGISYDRIFVTDDDQTMLERFWRESVDTITDLLKRYITAVTSPVNSQTVDITEIWSISLNVPTEYDTLLTNAINDLMISYITNSITAKWLMITNRADTEAYSNIATAQLQEISNLFHQRKAPVLS